MTAKVTDAAKNKKCPPPPDLTAKERALWVDVVQRSPLDVFGLMERKALLAYVKLTGELELTMQKKMSRNVLARVARLSSTLRQTALRLNLKELKRVAKRSAVATIDEEEVRILASTSDPDHPRHGLYAPRVIQ